MSHWQISFIFNTFLEGSMCVDRINAQSTCCSVTMMCNQDVSLTVTSGGLCIFYYSIVLGFTTNIIYVIGKYPTMFFSMKICVAVIRENWFDVISDIL